MDENTLYTWLKRYRENQDRPFVGSGRILPENEEIVRLRRENKDLREEVYILKNAAAYCARLKGAEGILKGFWRTRTEVANIVHLAINGN